MAKNSNIIIIGDGVQYEYELPPMPKDEKEIEGYNLKKSDQVWRRPDVIRNTNRLQEKEKIQYEEKMRDKFHNGHWMFIDGEPVWITGMHWDFLVMNKFDFGYPMYLDNQRFDFYFRDLIRKDKNAYGKVILKCRRCGMTAQEISEAIYTLLEDESCMIGLQSNERTKCFQTLMHPLIDTFLKRPRWMRDDYYKPSGKPPRNSLELISNKIDVLDGDDETEGTALGGKVNGYATVAAAMDGTKKRLIVMDESFKWKEASIRDTLNINKKCVVEYGIKGKIDVLSTMGDSDDVVNAVKEGCQLIRDSNPKVLDANGRTTSGLKDWFVSAIHSADIPEEHRDPTYTKFGKVNKDSAEAYVKAEVNKYPKNSKSYVFEMRKMPLTKSQGMMTASLQSYFRKLSLQLRLQELGEMPIDEKPYVIGRLENRKDGGVDFEPDAENGHWLVAVQPYFSADKNIDTRNRFKKSYNGIYFPVRNPEGAIGYDPVRYRKEDTTSKNLSNSAIIVFQKFDYFGSGNANNFCALYLNRSDDPDDDHRECVKACKFWGYPVMHERVIEKVKEIFDNENCVPFLLKSERDDIEGMVIDSGGKAVKNGLNMMVTMFRQPQEENEKDMIMTMPFEAPLSDMDNIDLANTTPFDTFMAMNQLMYALKQIEYTNLSETETETERMLFGELYPLRTKPKTDAYNRQQNPY